MLTLGSATSASAQIVAYDFGNVSGSPTAVPTSSNLLQASGSSLTSSGGLTFTVVTGYSPNTSNPRLQVTGWNGSGTQYLAFNVTSVNGYLLNFDGFNMNARTNAVPFTGTVQYSLNNFATAGTTLLTFSPNVGSFNSVGNNITALQVPNVAFRIYYSGTTGSDLVLDDIQVTSNVVPVPEPGSMLLTGFGLTCMTGLVRKRRRKVALAL